MTRKERRRMLEVLRALCADDPLVMEQAQTMSGPTLEAYCQRLVAGQFDQKALSLKPDL